MMLDTYTFSRVYINNTNKVNALKCFLSDSDLSIDYDVECFIVAYCENEIIGCGGIAGNILKSIALSPLLRGHGFALKLLTELVSLAYEMDRFDLFLFTKPENEAIFRQAGFFPIASAASKVVLMENSNSRINNYCQQLSLSHKMGNKIGSIVINANPFTLGHQYLIEQAAKSCDWLHLFVVKEDRSYFSYEDRLNMIQAGTSHINNIQIHTGSEYLISRATFPSYFIKESGVIDFCHTAIDLQIFRNYIAPSLGITHRFVGSEPFCSVTNFYNNQMEHWLTTPTLSSPIVSFCEIERIAVDDTPISASRVRALLNTGNLLATNPLVPDSTYLYLEKKHTPQIPPHQSINTQFVAA